MCSQRARIGTVSDGLGDYVISNVPANLGTPLKSHTLGLKVILENILINQDRTSYQNIQLKEEALKGEEIIEGY